MNIIFDLDGTLIDSKKRLFTLFDDLSPYSKLSYSEYWTLKKNKISNQEILVEYFNYTEKEVENFVTEWMLKIETPYYLNFDKAIQGVQSKIKEMCKSYDLFVCTARQSKQAVFRQLEKINLTGCFREILVTEQKYSKELLISEHVHTLSPCDWMIGDTGYDIQVGKALNIKTCAVTSGFLSRARLLEYMPDEIIESITQFHG